MEPQNKIRAAFDGISASEKLKADTRNFLRDARHNGGRQMRPALRWAVGVACLLLFFFLGAESHKLFWTPFSYVSIDVNPSLELILNRFDRVISAEAYNEDGRIILDRVSIRGKHYTDAVEEIVESSAMEPYLSENAGLTFTVAAVSGQKEKELLSEIEKSSGYVKHGGVGVGADIMMVEEAHENGFSLGKYIAYKVLCGYDASVTVEDCHSMSMSEIHGLIQEHESAHGEMHDDSFRENGNPDTVPDLDQNAGRYEESSDGNAGEESGTDSSGAEASAEDQEGNKKDSQEESVVPESNFGSGHHGSHHSGHGDHGK